ncbi:hypothetical protein G7046_g612 [Stylonectria norvegica]|nr:hypothetical protein G7046_g612 [Stylonectria norvegica]
MSQGFPTFLKLPAEVRLMIWTYALPKPRVFEILDTPRSNIKTPAQAGLAFANRFHQPPPSLAAVCGEARDFVLHRYQPLTLSNTTKYIDPARDIILLEPYLLTRRLLRALHFLAQIRSIRDRISQLALGTSYGFNMGIFHPILGGKMSKNSMKMLLEKLANFPRLRKLLFVVHQEFQLSHRSLALPGWSHRMQLLQSTCPLQSDKDEEARFHPPRFSHINDFKYYPFQMEDGKRGRPDMRRFDEVHEVDCTPTNADWRRFRTRFLRAICLAFERESLAHASRAKPALRIEGARLLWTYHPS